MKRHKIFLQLHSLSSSQTCISIQDMVTNEKQSHGSTLTTCGCHLVSCESWVAWKWREPNSETRHFFEFLLLPVVVTLSLFNPFMVFPQIFSMNLLLLLTDILCFISWKKRRLYLISFLWWWWWQWKRERILCQSIAFLSLSHPSFIISFVTHVTDFSARCFCCLPLLLYPFTSFAANSFAKMKRVRDGIRERDVQSKRLKQKADRISSIIDHFFFLLPPSPPSPSFTLFHLFPFLSFLKEHLLLWYSFLCCHPFSSFLSVVSLLINLSPDACSVLQVRLLREKEREFVHFMSHSLCAFLWFFDINSSGWWWLTLCSRKRPL